MWCINTQPNDHTKAQVQVFKRPELNKIQESISFLFRPCSGLVISGYSKTLTDKSLITKLAKAITPYKKFRKMYKVDTTGEFRGEQERDFVNILNYLIFFT